MVTIIDFKKRENSEGKEFAVLILQGEIETVRSKTTNRPYITARKSSVPTTLDENLLKAAKDAAILARFDRKPDAPAFQKGTITYIFMLR